MIISRAEIASALSAYKTVKRKPSTAATPLDTTDSFERSDAASSLGAYHSAAAEPFYRPALVDHLRRQISEGRYSVPTEDIVERLLGRLLIAAAY
ncbi:MAG TPA: flagellar biosynthesis anti-sigma factor FlgM [Xanthomonadales bacterium]|nr:flagellar biosynthesis anti-sigma factor FlgM [Xanthomonadales bacterium]